jgi:hypothetical protein
VGSQGILAVSEGKEGGEKLNAKTAKNAKRGRREMEPRMNSDGHGFGLVSLICTWRILSFTDAGARS